MEIRTLVDLYHRSLQEHPRDAMFRYKSNGRWTDVSSREFATAVDEVASALLVLGVAAGDRVALLSHNRMEWALADLAILSVGAVCVPIYPTLLTDQIDFLLTDSEPVAIFCENAQQVAKLEGATERHASLRDVLCFEKAERADVLSLEKLREIGRLNLEGKREEIRSRSAAIEPDDLATLVYTSGTTGNPKGAMLTHANITTNVETALGLFEMENLDSCLSFLPLSHILERTAGYYLMLRAGVCITFAQSVETVAADMAEVRPSIMISVPRLYEKIYARVLESASQGSSLARKIFDWARGVGKEYTDRVVAGRSIGPGLRLRRAIADRLVFRKLRARTGGKLRFFVSGGAPLAKEIAEFFFAAGLPILEGYGLTETSPVISVNTFERFRPGSVGPPIPGVEVRIAEDGEILVRGPNVMKGYWRREAETAEALADGWFHTGDIGHIDEDGFLFITDRKKDLIVTAGGKNIAPQPVESELKLSKFVAEAVVIGDRRRYLTALLIPNFETLEAWAHQRGLAVEDRTALVQRPETQELYSELVNAVNGRLASFEQIKYFRILDHEFSLEDGQLTPSLKVRRKLVSERYADIIDQMYRDS